MIDQRLFGVTSRGAAVSLFEIQKGGAVLRCMEYGGALLSLEVADRWGKSDNVLLAYDSLEEYERDCCWCSMACGPVAGRIAGAYVDLDGVSYPLEANEGTTCLHSGSAGFSRQVWRGAPFHHDDEEGASFSLSTNFLGAKLDVRLSYSLDSQGDLKIRWFGQTSAPTLLAPTFHGYVCLGGSNASVRGHRLTLNCDRYMPVNEQKLPQNPCSVTETPFDLRDSRVLGETPGYDNAFLTSKNDSAPTAVLEDDATGRRVEVLSDQPCLVVYTGGGFDKTHVFSGGQTGFPFAAVALESQWYPNASECNLPLPVLRPGAVYTSETVWRFSTF